MRADRLLRRLTTSVVVIVGVVTLTFFAARVVPSDPAQLYAGQRANAARVAEVRARFGLDRPLPEQYVRYVGGLLAGEFGDSFKSKRAVADDLRIYLPPAGHGVVGQSLANLLTFPFVRQAVERGELNMDGAWFSIGRGELHWRDPASGAFSVVSAASDTVDRGEGI